MYVNDGFWKWSTHWVVFFFYSSYLHDNEFTLGTAEIVKLLSKTERHCGIRGGILTILVQLQSWTNTSLFKIKPLRESNDSSSYILLSALSIREEIYVFSSDYSSTRLLFEVLNTWMFIWAHLERTCPCQISWQQNPCRVCKAWGRTVSPYPPARSRKHDSGTAFWWRCPPGWHEPARLSPGGPGACVWHGAGVQIQWDRRGGSERSACCLNCRGHCEPGAAGGRSCSLRNDWPSCSASAFLCSKSWSTSGKKLESRALGKFLQIKKRKKERKTPIYTFCSLSVWC